MKEQIKYKKIRGLNRRIRDIHRWGNNNIDLDMSALETYHREYVKFWVSPWSRISIVNSVYPEPEGEVKLLMMEYLWKIYQTWHRTLSASYDDFYLNIWIFENEIRRSQVVCAINENQNFYNNTFSDIEDERSIQTSQHYSLETSVLLDEYTWKQCRVLETYDPNDEYENEQIDSFAPEKLLEINNLGHQVVEQDRVWLNNKK